MLVMNSQTGHFIHFYYKIALGFSDISLYFQCSRYCSNLRLKLSCITWCHLTLLELIYLFTQKVAKRMLVFLTRL